MNAEEVPSLLDENERLREELSEEMLESGQLTIERDAARSELAAARRVVQAVEALFHGGPDTSCRTVWQDGIECVSVPLDDLRAAVGGPGPTPEPASTIEIGGQVMTEAQYNAARYPLIDANPGLVIPNDAMSVEFGPGPTDDERPAPDDSLPSFDWLPAYLNDVGLADDERPATTREVGSGPTNPLPKGADDE